MICTNLIVIQFQLRLIFIMVIIMKEEMVLNEEETEIKIHSNVIETSQKKTIEESSD